MLLHLFGTFREGIDDYQYPLAAKKIFQKFIIDLVSRISIDDAFDDCNDVSAEMADNIPFSATEWKIDSWSLDQVVLSPNEAFWDTTKKPIASSVVMVPRTDDGGVASLLSGESDFIFPQAYAGITDALNDPNIQFEPGYGTNYEGLYFQQQEGPFADDDFRAAFSKSIDRDLILKNVYDPIFPGAPLLNCGLWVPTIGPWCDKVAAESNNKLKCQLLPAMSGGGTPPQLVGALFRLSLDLDLVHVPFSGGGPAIGSTVAGHTPVSFGAMAPAVPLVKDGKLRALAVTSKARTAVLPEVPTMAEAGYPDVEGSSWTAVVVPAGTPKEIIASLHRMIAAIVALPDIKERLGALGYEPIGSTPDQCLEFFKTEMAKWSKVIRASGIKAE